MAKASILSKRFTELSAQADEVEKTKKYQHSDMFQGYVIDDNAFLNWQVKARNLLSAACGKDSEHYREFENNERPKFMDTNYEILMRLKAVFLAAKEDYDGVTAQPCASADWPRRVSRIA